MTKRYVDHYAGERKQDRRTPANFFIPLNDKYKFTLDGAATEENALLSKFSSPDCPLPWNGERVFCNPPWSDVRPFVEKAVDAELAVLLVPARTNCKWFHRALELGAKVEFWKGKLNFSGPWNSPIDCVLLVFGDDSESFHVGSEHQTLHGDLQAESTRSTEQVATES